MALPMKRRYFVLDSYSIKITFIMLKIWSIWITKNVSINVSLGD